jgi:hypothetical protein
MIMPFALSRSELFIYYPRLRHEVVQPLNFVAQDMFRGECNSLVH